MVDEKNLHAKVLPASKEGIPIHLRGFHELVDGDWKLDADLMRSVVAGKADVQIWMSTEILGALQVHHLLELRASFHCRVHRFHLDKEGRLKLWATRDHRLEILKKKEEGYFLPAR